MKTSRCCVGNYRQWICLGLVLLAVVFVTGCGRPKTPEKVLLEDFQQPADRNLTAQFELLAQTGTAQWIDSNLVKPYLDDATTAELQVTGIEVCDGQFPGRPEIERAVKDCARILGVPPPRVYVANQASEEILVVGIADPTIVLSSSLFQRFSDERELRFVIGREMGHIRARHTKWQFVIRGIVNTFPKMVIIPDELALAPFIPFFKWAREAEMTADNAGLICCQDLRTAEQALVHLELGLREDVNVDKFLNQPEIHDVSKFAEGVLYWKQLTRPQPFLPDRLRQLRKFAASRQYQHLWE